MIELAAVIFLGLRIAATTFLWKVLKVQIDLLRRPIKLDPEMYDEQDIKDVWNFRKTLHYITIALYVGNFIPIVLDSFVILQSVGLLDGYRTTPVLVVYAASNAITMLLATILIFNIYRLATQTKEVTDLEIEHLRRTRDNK